MPNVKVLEFPVRRDREPVPVIALYRCAGGCDRLVGGPLCLCISCAAQAEGDE